MALPRTRPEEDSNKQEMPTQISHLPSELLFSILSRLPLMSLLRSAKYTCKLWYSIINDPVFCDSHVPTSPGYLYVPSRTNTGLYIVDNSTLAIKLPADLSYSNDYRANHSCRGLILYWSWEDLSICICNPILGDQVTLPSLVKKSIGATDKASSTASSDLNPYTWGFGYAALTYQYKCLSFLLTRHPNYFVALLGKIITLGEESWRDLSVPQGCIWSDSVYCNGTLYYSLISFTQVREYDIVSFDLNTEKYRLRHVSPIPTRRNLQYLTVFGKTVAAVIPTQDDGQEVWMLVDEAENIWVQKYRFCDPPELDDVISFTTYFRYFRFSGLWMNQEMYGLELILGKFGNYEGCRLLLYNVSHKTYTDLKLPLMDDVDANAAAGAIPPPLLITHLGSLVSPSKIVKMAINQRLWAPRWRGEKALISNFNNVYRRCNNPMGSVSEFWRCLDGNWVWDFSNITPGGSQSLDEDVLLGFLPDAGPSEEIDRWVWQGPGKKFSVKDMVEIIRGNRRVREGSGDLSFPAKLVWVPLVPPKICFLAWLIWRESALFGLVGRPGCQGGGQM